MTMEFRKNITPAIASTNAAVSAMCVNECLKFINGCNKSVDTFTFYSGSRMTTADATDHHPEEDCAVCGIYVLNQEVKATETLRAWSVRFYASKIAVKESFYKKSMKDSNKMLDAADKLQKVYTIDELTLYPQSGDLRMFFGEKGLGKEHAAANMDKTFAQLIEEGLMTSNTTFSGICPFVEHNKITCIFSVV